MSNSSPRPDPETPLADATDRDRIRQLLCRLARAVDRVDEDGILACYTHDAREEHGVFSGAAADFARSGSRRSSDNLAASHQLAQSLITTDGDSATSETYFHCFQLTASSDGPIELLTWGRYLDRLQRHRGIWRIAHRQVVLDWATERVGSPWKHLDRFVPGDRYPDDLVYRLDS